MTSRHAGQKQIDYNKKLIGLPLDEEKGEDYQLF